MAQSSGQLAGRAVRRIAQGWGTVATLGVAVGAMAGFGCKRLTPIESMRLIERELPGFSISLPFAEELPSDRPYREGLFDLVDIGGQGGAIRVRWEAGKLDEEMEEQAARAIAKLSDVQLLPTERWPGPQGSIVSTFAMRSSSDWIWTSTMQCGGRKISVFSKGPVAMGGLHRRILPTLVCRPEPANEAKLTALRWTIALPAGWSRGEAPPGRVRLTDGEREINVRGGFDPSEHASVREMLGALLSQGDIKITVGNWEGGRMSMQGTISGEPVFGWAWLVDCPGDGLLLLAVAQDAAGAAELSELVTTKGRCLQADEEPPPWPEPLPSSSAAQPEPT